MANTPFSLNTSTLLQGGGLLSSALLATGCNMDATSTATAVVTVGALGLGAWAAHRRLSRMRESGAIRETPLLNQREIPDEVVRGNLAAELAERYPVLGDPVFEPLRNAIVKNVFETWDQQGRLVDTAYPDLRGCVVESLMENRVAEIARSLEGATGAKERLRDGLSGDGLGNRSRRWAPRDVESAALSSLKSAYPVFENADYAPLAAAVAKNAFGDWLKADGPALMDKPGPATPLVESFVHDRVHKLMEHLSSQPVSAKLTALLRDLRRNERRRSMESPTLFHRLQNAARELEILALHLAQLKLPNAGIARQIQKTISALREAPEAIPAEDLKRFAGLEGQEGDARLLKELVARLPALQAKAAETRTKEDAVVRERLRWLQAAVAGSESVAGLDAAFVGSVHPAVPEWARSVAFQRKGAKGPESRMTLTPDGTVADALGFEVIYRDGGYWLRDGRGFSRLHPSNWLRAFVVNSQRMAAGGVWPLKSGDRLKIGTDVEIEFLLPEIPHLERLRLRIARITSLKELARLLKDEGRRALAQQIEDYLADGEAFHEIPAEGGLAAKLLELVLRREAGRLHEEHLLNLPYPEAELRMIGLARAVDQAVSMEDLAGIVRESFLSGGEDVARTISRVAEEAVGFRSFEQIPEVFGIRAKAVFFAQEEERKLRAEVFKLRGNVAQLTQDLHDANSGIANRDRTIGETNKRNEELTRQIAAAREALRQQEIEARAEKERLEQEHAQAMRREANIRADMAQIHKDAQEAKDAAHREAQAQKDAAHRQAQDQKDADHRGTMARLRQEHSDAIDAKNREMADQDTAHAGAIAAIEAAMQSAQSAHEAAVSERERAHANEIAAREAAMREAQSAHEAAVAERERAHAEAMAAKERDMEADRRAHAAAMAQNVQEHEEAVAALAAAHRQAIETLAAEHAAAMAEEAARQRLAAEGHARDLAELEARRAAEESRADELGRLRDGKERERAAAQSEVERLTALLAEAEATRDRYRDERNAVRGELSTTRAHLGVRDGELAAEREKVRQNDIDIALLRDERDTAQRTANRLDGELEDARREIDRLLNEECPKLDGQIKAARRELKDMWSAITDFENAYPVYLAEVGRLVRTGAELQRVEEYLDKLSEVYEALDAKLKVAGQEPPPAATAVVDEAPLTEIEFETVTDEHAIPTAFPDEVTRPAIKISTPVPPPPPPEAVSTSSMRRLLSPYFGNADPRTMRVETFAVSDTKILNNMDGNDIGTAYLRAGNLQDDDGGFHIEANDGSILSGKTTIADAKPARDGTVTQEDGIYLASYRLPDGREVKIMAGADGAGGMGGGDMVSSAFLQGIHAAVHQAAAEQRADLTAGELFQSGNEAAIFQKLEPDRPGAIKATGSATVVVVIGGQMTAATIGDAMLLHGRPRADGTYEAVGYSDVDHLSTLKDDRLMSALRMTAHGEFITRGIGNVSNPEAYRNGTETADQKAFRQPHLYAGELRKGDKISFGSDGMIENTVGHDYKVYGSSGQRFVSARSGLPIRALSAGDMSAFLKFMQATAGDVNAGAYLHDLAARNQTIVRPGNGAAAQFPPPVVEVNGVRIELPRKRGKDNIFGIAYEEGEGPLAPAIAAPVGHAPLEALLPELSAIFFGGADPRKDKIKVDVRGSRPLPCPGGRTPGHAYICAGGLDDRKGFRLDDGSFLSAQTSVGVSKSKTHPRQEDGYYFAKYNLPDGTPVKIIAISDGAGGEGQTGFVASSAFLQAVHARTVEASMNGQAVLAGDLLESGRAGLYKQNELGVSDGRAKATGSIVVVVGNTATVATIGDSTVLHSERRPDGTFRTARYSAADYTEVGPLKSTGLIGAKDEPNAHLYYIGDVQPGSVFTMSSDGGHENIHGHTFKLQTSQATRSLSAAINHVHVPPPTEDTFRTQDRILSLVAGQENAAGHLHDFALEAMKRPHPPEGQPPAPVAPISVMGIPVPAPVKTDRTNDNIVFAVLEHAQSPFAGIAPPEGYESMPEVVAVGREALPQVSFSVRPGERSQHNDKYLVLGRSPDLNDRGVPHGSVSRQHAHLVYNQQKNGNFEANTWYLRPISDNPNGTHVNGEAVAKDAWVALPRGGARLRLGGVPLLVSYGAGDALNFVTDNAALAALGQLPQPPHPGAIPPLPPVPASRRGAPASPVPSPASPASVRHPSRPPQVEKGGNGTKVVTLNGLDVLTMVSGSALSTTDTFVQVQGAARSAELVCETGFFGGDRYVTIIRQGGGFRVENPHKKKKIVAYPPGAPAGSGLEILPGNARDLPDGTGLLINDQLRYTVRSENI
ncbi:MAG TPA: FHA domain-containing protein [bacterium]|nr:FHA domain-containing protein [bacterium]